MAIARSVWVSYHPSCAAIVGRTWPSSPPPPPHPHDALRRGHAAGALNDHAPTIDASDQNLIPYGTPRRKIARCKISIAGAMTAGIRGGSIGWIQSIVATPSVRCAMSKTGKRKSSRSTRRKLRSPGRPPVLAKRAAPLLEGNRARSLQ